MSERFLIVRLSSLGDIVHTLPAAAALRDSFPEAKIDWLVDTKWASILRGNADLNEVIAVDTRKLSEVLTIIGQLRDGHYTCALDFQSLYKSALLAKLSGAPKRVGFDWAYARESASTLFYTQKIHPAGAHKIEHNLDLVRAAGAKVGTPRFSVPKSEEAERWAVEKLSEHGLREFFVTSPGGGWRSKCWPPERYAELHSELARQTGMRGIINFGPGEEALAQAVVRAAGEPAPLSLQMDIPQLAAVLRRARLMIAADSGPLHLAAALGTPALGLYGATDPARNGPWGAKTRVIRKAEPNETTYKRGDSYSSAMLRITVPEVYGAAVELLEQK